MTRFEGRNLDEVLEQAAGSLGVKRHALTYHVVLEKRGFLGGIKRIVVEAEINPAVGQEEHAAETGAPIVPGGLDYAPGARGEGRREGRGRGGRQRGSGPKEPGRDRPRAPRSAAEEIPSQEPESDSARAIREWCQRLLDLADLAMESRSTESEEKVVIRLYGSDRERLLDRDGELLDSLQTIVTKTLSARQLDKRVEVDCADFRGQRSQELEQKARAIADQVRADGEEQMLPAMNPMERRIVHVTLQDDAEVETESRGEGFYKRVAIIPRRASAE